jgi:hypothetical protein
VNVGGRFLGSFELEESAAQVARSGRERHMPYAVD